MENPTPPHESFSDKLAGLVARQTEECPVCSQHVDYLVQLDGDVYAQPCACRLFQGNIPATWWMTRQRRG